MLKRSSGEGWRTEEADLNFDNPTLFTELGKGLTNLQGEARHAVHVLQA